MPVKSTRQSGDKKTNKSSKGSKKRNSKKTEDKKTVPKKKKFVIKSKKKSTKENDIKIQKKAIQKKIKTAAEDIPKLIMREVQEKEEREVSHSQPMPKKVSFDRVGHDDYYRAQGSRKKLLWLGVIVVTVSILTIWVWNMRTVIYDARLANDNGQTRNFLRELNEGVTSIFDSTIDNPPTNIEQILQEEITKDKMKNELVAELTAAIKSSSSTIDSFSSSTITATSTLGTATSTLDSDIDALAEIIKSAE